MDSDLPATGTAQFLELLSPYVPDTFINELVPRHRGRGRRQQLSSAQLYRATLLSVLTPVHTFNHLVRLLPEQRAWRRFARLSNRQAVPDVWMLHRFRERCGVSGLRQSTTENPALALIDATDLAAACSGHRKREPAGIRPSTPRWEDGRSNAGRVTASSVTRSTPSGSGCAVMNAAYCWRRWQRYPHLIVADMGYIDAGTKRELRESRQIAVVTRLRENMRLVAPFETCERAVCAQGQRLQWLGYEAADQLQQGMLSGAGLAAPRNCARRNRPLRPVHLGHPSVA